MIPFRILLEWIVYHQWIRNSLCVVVHFLRETYFTSRWPEHGPACISGLRFKISLKKWIR